MERSEHSLRRCIKELIEEEVLNYSSEKHPKIIAECNQYLLKKHARQADIEIVFNSSEFYLQTIPVPLEEIVLAFDPEREEWWWLKYVFLLMREEEPTETIKPIRRIVRQSFNIDGFPEFLEYYQYDTELQKAIQLAFNHSLDKKEQSGIH